MSLGIPGLLHRVFERSWALTCHSGRAAGACRVHLLHEGGWELLDTSFLAWEGFQAMDEYPECAPACLWLCSLLPHVL